ncbi:MAG: PPC domain-containing protein, partial [bacterium]|nr:PPC domain-containing protein [bacterium]
DDTEDPAAFGTLMTGAVNCLPDLFLTDILDEMGLRPDELSTEQRACLQEWISGFNWAALDDTEDPAAFGTLMTGAVNCLPDLFLTDILDEMDLRPDELSTEQRACLQEWISGFNWAALDDDPTALAALAMGPAICLADEDTDDHANLHSGASTAAIGEPTDGTLDYDGDVDVFVFEAQQERIYEIHVTPGTLEDPTLELSDADGAFLDYNDDYGGSLASRLAWRAPASGDYYLSVGGFGTGSYTLTVTLIDITDDHANLQGSATAAAIGEPTDGAIDYDGDVDVFVFEAQQERIYEIHVTPGTLEDPTLELSDADGFYLVNNDDYGDSPASGLTWPAPATGDYYLTVGGYGTGSYTVTVTLTDITDDHANLQSGASTAAIGEPTDGAIDYDDDVDYFAFEARQGQLYEIHVTLGTLEDSVLDLWDADGFYLADNDDYGDSLASRLIWQAPASVDYYVAVGGFGTRTGSYTLTVTLIDITDDHANLQGSATAAAIGEPTDGTVDYDGDVDVFVFEAQQERIYEIHVTPGTLQDPTLELSDADGAFLDYNDDYGNSSASGLTWQAPATGDYYLAVGGYGTGSYTLTVTISDITDDHANLHSGASTAAIGEPTDGAIDYDDDVDYFAFEAQQGQLYEIHVTPGTLEDPTLELSDADGAFLDYNDDYGDSLASRLAWTAPATGDYYLAVGGYGTGSYTLTVTISDITDDTST